MKSRISFFNGAAFKKDLTRFAPVWLLYTVCLLLGLVMMADSGLDYWLSANTAGCISFMGLVNCAYGLLCALLLFGDLTTPRLCNAIHALPLRRETWFGTHVISGLFFSFVPSLIMTGAAEAATLFSGMERGWQIPLYWLLGTNLEFVFFFGLAVFCMMLSGNRIGASVTYAIANFAGYLAYFMADVVYAPHLPGVIPQVDTFLPFSPAPLIISKQFIDTEQIREFVRYASDGSATYNVYGVFTVTENWWYLWVYAAVGAALLVPALLLYKKRKLECAGDLMSTRLLEPVFLAIFALVTGSCLQLFFVAFNGYEAYGSATFLWFGLAIGWFVGLMLLRKTSRVFSVKSFLGLGALAAALALSLLLNSMDLFGITRWVPQAEEVQSLTLHLSYINSITLEDPEDIAEAIRLHQIGTEEHLEGTMGAVNRPVVLQEGAGTQVSFEYILKGGSKKAREYFVLIDSEAGDLTAKFFSRPESVLNRYYGALEGYTKDDLERFMDYPERVSISGIDLAPELLTKENMESLLNAILADSEEGSLVQHSAFHPEPIYQDEELEIQYWSYYMTIELPEDTIHFDVYPECRHILAWIEEMGLTDDLHQMILENNGIG